VYRSIPEYLSDTTTEPTTCYSAIFILDTLSF
jgi:hypothetical protein